VLFESVGPYKEGESLGKQFHVSYDQHLRAYT